jgi:CDC45-like protein
MIVPLDQGDAMIRWMKGGHNEAGTALREGGLVASSQSLYTQGKDEKENDSHVLVIGRRGIDSLCALKIMLGLFHAESLLYTLAILDDDGDADHAISDVEDDESLDALLRAKDQGAFIYGLDDVILEARQVMHQMRRFSQTTGNDRRWCVLLVDLGARLNIPALLDLLEDADSLGAKQLTRLFIMDSHRPVHLANLYDNTHVAILDDGALRAIGEIYWPYFSAILQNDSQNESSDDGEAYLGQPRKKTSGGSRSMKRKAESQLNAYAMGHLLEEADEDSSSASVTVLSTFAYAVASQLGRTNATILWTCLVGVAGRIHIEQHMNSIEAAEESWDSYIQLMKSEVSRHSRTKGDGQLTSESSSIVSNLASSLSLVEEPLLFMYRHWTLYEGMLYSWSLHSALHLQTTAQFTKDSHMGSKTVSSLSATDMDSSPCVMLDVFLAKLGFSLASARQPFLYFERLHFKRLTRFLAKDLNLTRRMFVQTASGSVGPVSALDLAHLLQARLSSARFTDVLLQADVLLATQAAPALNGYNELASMPSLVTPVSPFTSTVRRALELQKARLYLATKIMRDHILKTIKRQAFHLLILSPEKYPILLSSMQAATVTTLDYIQLLHSSSVERLYFGRQLVNFPLKRAIQFPLLIAAAHKRTYHCSLISAIGGEKNNSYSAYSMYLALKRAFYLLDQPRASVSSLSLEFLASLPDPPSPFAPTNFILSFVQFSKFIQLLKFDFELQPSQSLSMLKPVSTRAQIHESDSESGGNQQLQEDDSAAAESEQAQSNLKSRGRPTNEFLQDEATDAEVSQDELDEETEEADFNSVEDNFIDHSDDESNPQ